MSEPELAALAAQAPEGLYAGVLAERKDSFIADWWLAGLNNKSGAAGRTEDCWPGALRAVENDFSDGARTRASRRLRKQAKRA
jgi:hypothetical protein